ncbi:unnamed protein product [Adineta ricciae]|uniref:HAT C-terminal dimerisation domain-containing protein n=1 Tax=Adineta ricciae TaxID=249248 RepID=A0A815R4G8_ADIRI|nr:unnamed protein product [Adineta ricciae]
MSSRSSRRSLSRASSISSEPSTPITRRRKPQMNTNSRIQKSSSNSSKPEIRSLRRLQTKTKTVRWTDNNDGNSSNSDDDYQREETQYRRLSTTESSNIDNECDETNPSAIIESLSISHSKTNDNIMNSQITVHPSDETEIEMQENRSFMNKKNDSATDTQAAGRHETKTERILDLFVECVEEDGTTVLACKLCPTRIKKQIRSTANLRRHVGSVHGQKAFLFKSQLKERRSESSSLSNQFKARLDEKQVNAIILDSRPFNDFSKYGMRDFLTYTVPGYKPLHRTTVRKRISKLYHEHREKLRKILGGVSDLSLTTDIWKDSRHRCFIGITGHFYDKNYTFTSLTLSFQMIRGRHFAIRLAKYIKREILALDIQDKVRSITTDNAANIVGAISKVGIGEHYSCMAHNLHLMVKAILFPPEQKKSHTSAPTSTAEQQSNDDDHSAEDIESSNDCTISEEESSDNDADQENDSSTNSSEDSSTEDDYSSSDSGESDNESTSANVSVHKTVLRIRSLIKQVRSVVGLVHRSAPLNEYVKEQAKMKNLPGQVNATVNVLTLIDQACSIISRQRYHTSSMGYVITCGLHHALLKPSSSPFATIEDILKKHLFHAFQKHFDRKISNENKQTLLIAAYLDPSTFFRMTINDRKYAEELILNALNSSGLRPGGQDNPSVGNELQKQVNDPVDLFYINCGLSQTTLSKFMNSVPHRTIEEELSYYSDRVKQHSVLKDFWSRYQNDLPRLAELVRSYNIRPVSSVPSEALFSKAGYIHRKHRSSLNPETLKYSMVLRDKNILSSIVID